MENNIQISSPVTQNAIQNIGTKKAEELKDASLIIRSSLDVLDRVTTSSTLTNKDVLEMNNNKGFLAIAKETIRSIDDGISKLHDLNSAFNSTSIGHGDRINILNRTNEIVQDLETSIKNTRFNDKSIASTSAHNIGSSQIVIGSNDTKKEESQIPNLEKIDKAIEILTKNKEKITEKINIISDFLEEKEVFVETKDPIQNNQQKLDILQENLRDKNEYLSIAHRATNERLASLIL